jgi:PAS domain S-box-containing protein
MSEEFSENADAESQNSALKEELKSLRARNEVLSRQVISLIQSRQFIDGKKPSSDNYKGKLSDFIWRISGQSESDDLYQKLAEEFLLEMGADRVSILVQGSGSQSSLVVTQQACSPELPEVPLPYVVSQEPGDTYRGFLEKVIEERRVLSASWEEGVEIHPQIEIAGATAGMLEIEGESENDWIVCLQWVEGMPNWSLRDVRLFEDMVSYAGIVIEQAQLASSIKELRDQNESLIQSMPSAIIGLDFLGNVTFWNGKAEEFFRISEEEGLGKNFFELVPEFASVQEHLMNVLYQEEELVLEPVLLQQDSRVRHLQPHLFSMFAVDRGEIALRIDDISRQVDLQNQLLHAQKMETVGTLAGGLAHDFNNILSGVVGAASLLLRRWRKKDVSTSDREDVELMMKSAQKATDLANRLLVLTRKSEKEFKPVDLVSCLEHVSSMCRSSFGQSIQIRLQTALNHAWVNGVESQIENAILNLCVNARDAMPDGGTLSLHLEGYERSSSEEGVVPMYKIRVEDTGKGMLPEVKSRIFNAFYTTKPDTGTGLGLAIVEKSIEEHKGFVEVFSTPSEGSSFVLHFPAGDEKGVVAVTVGREKKPCRFKLLLVDDDAMIRNVAGRILQDLDYETSTCASGSEAIAKVDSGEVFDLVILDVDMPGLNGLEVFRMIRRLRANLKVLFCTARGSRYDLESFLGQGGVGVLEKPFTFDQLEAAVASLILPG